MHHYASLCIHYACIMTHLQVVPSVPAGPGRSRLVPAGPERSRAVPSGPESRPELPRGPLADSLRVQATPITVATEHDKDEGSKAFFL